MLQSEKAVFKENETNFWFRLGKLWGAPVSSGGGSTYGRKRRQISNSILLANQLSGARGAPLSRGGSSYGRKRRSPGEFVVDDVHVDWKLMWNWLLR